MTYPVHPAAELFPMIEGDEFDELVADIDKNGVIEPVWLTPAGELLDGRNRVKAAEKVGATWQTRTYTGDDPIGFVVSQNLRRRHLNTGQKAFLGLEIEAVYAKEAEARMKAGKADPEADRPQGHRAPQSRDKAAEVAGTSGRAVARAKRVNSEAPDLAEQVKAGTLALDAAEKEVKRRKRQQKDAEARQATPPPILDEPIKVEGDGWTLYHGDFRKILAGAEWNGTIDGIVTDPPYPDEFLHLLDDLSQIGARVLRDQAICAVLFGQMSLDEVYRRLGRHLSYKWTYAELIPQSSNRMVGRHITSNWKPWLVYANGKWPSGRIDWHTDVMQGPKPGNEFSWQQDTAAAVHLIENLVPAGGVVLDPFAGLGNYGVAAITSGRSFIGIELDADRFQKATERLRHGE